MYLQVLKLTRWMKRAHVSSVTAAGITNLVSPAYFSYCCVQVIVHFHAEFGHYLITGLRIILGVCKFFLKI